MSEIKTVDDLIVYIDSLANYYKSGEMCSMAESSWGEHVSREILEKAKELKANMQSMLDEFEELKFRMEGLEK
jgi:hypothetical protein